MPSNTIYNKRHTKHAYETGFMFNYAFNNQIKNFKFMKNDNELNFLMETNLFLIVTK